MNICEAICEATRLTPTTSTLIDFIVTTKKDLVKQTRVFPLGISDHNLVFSTLKLRMKRSPKKIIKRLDLDTFRADIAAAPLHVATVCNEPDNQLQYNTTIFLFLYS